MQIVLTPAVLEAEQHYYGSTYQPYSEIPDSEPLRQGEVEMIQTRDSFYIATVTENGWPYVQHRGGPAGFLRALGPHQIGFADYGGNRQLISVGSVSNVDRVSLFLMDYPRRQRLKILGHATVFDAREHREMIDSVEPPSGHGSKVERIFLIDVLSYDWNCPKFITPRFTAAEIEDSVTEMKAEIADLKAQLENLKEGR